MIYIYSTPQAVAETDYYFFKYLIRNVDLTFSQISHECHEVKNKLNSKESTILIGICKEAGYYRPKCPSSLNGSALLAFRQQALKGKLGPDTG